LLHAGSKTVGLELFGAEEWPDHPSAVPGTFRVRRAKGAWLGAAKHTFFALDGLARVVAEEIGQALGLKAQAACARPDLPRGTRVRVWHGEAVAGLPAESCLTTTCTEPVQLLDGQWHVVVIIPGKGMVHVPCEHVEALR